MNIKNSDCVLVMLGLDIDEIKRLNKVIRMHNMTVYRDAKKIPLQIDTLVMSIGDISTILKFWDKLEGDIMQKDLERYRLYANICSTFYRMKQVGNKDIDTIENQNLK